ncbi:diguanylate cyclase (GGDEF)-like protein [Bradyrhizobium japonicum]|uniref:diguanylate cyclase n=1 Tax=Bradyrhizobium elkanii TaxID=29448 RepID=A0A1E3EVI7_BRAEL|nr:MULTISPECIES: sensor domain-containing diguanylate cyclase [Bradyrhizobium]MBP1298958.1 diguanylate cyclase (GGDEF)-like protein [Bradyrhizobium elkanii]MBP2428049.1 diguanylate cyclase (GGDEF)-like protein [Bradyrhizobium elkanii]MBR1158274.1 sensor domain-containing diguanylate cyclase [Bradyrhizobium elkanii]MCP1729726.1 diguanylate cyclase (GGDEF)-like protein [Bradyrhizobium elkanii]MCP1756465.1 diguanylate cyclase (GGDEF)-like protein [Bradyrhizobium elkanii]
MNGLLPKPKAVPTKRLLALGIGLVLCFSAICASILWEMASKDYRHAKEGATNLVASIASEIDRNIDLYDLSLQAVADGVKLPELGKISPELRQVVLFDRAATAKDLGSILVLNAAGDVTLDSRTLTPRTANFADRDFFRAHQTRADSGLFISAPWITSDGEYLISLSRRINNDDGSFAGVVAGSMRLSYFHNLFRKLNFGFGDSMALFNSDGVILMRAPFDISKIGQSIKDSLVFKQFPARQSGSYITKSIVDHVSRLYVFQAVGHNRLLIAEGLALDGIYADWWQQLWLIGSVVAALCGFSIVLMFYLVAALKRRAAAEDRLAHLASTDALTGLANRRRLDDTLDVEWRRGMRAKAPVSLLMIDVDHFKIYNDTYGHQAGDAVLTTVGRCIASSAKRATDLGARYGGEEFSVLLPGIGKTGALEIAERIRAKLAAARESEPELPTVSIGLSCLVPDHERTSRDLLKAADLALYQAKREGRDRVIVSPIGWDKSGKRHVA